jgi:hypothetical protein
MESNRPTLNDPNVGEQEIWCEFKNSRNPDLAQWEPYISMRFPAMCINLSDLDSLEPKPPEYVNNLWKYEAWGFGENGYAFPHICVIYWTFQTCLEKNQSGQVIMCQTHTSYLCQKSIFCSDSFSSASGTFNRPLKHVKFHWYLMFLKLKASVLLKNGVQEASEGHWRKTCHRFLKTLGHKGFPITLSMDK